MLLTLILTTLLFSCSTSFRHCYKNVCIGKMKELPYTLEETVTYFVQPDDFLLPKTNDVDMEELLLNNQHRYDCKNTTESILRDFRPWTVSTFLHLRPLCLQQQKLIRLSDPSEMGNLSMSEYVELILEDGFFPCSVIKIICEKEMGDRPELNGFYLDNTHCLQKLNRNLPSFLSSSVNVWSGKGCKNIKLFNLSGSKPFTVHVFDKAKPTGIKATEKAASIDPQLYVSNITGHLLLDRTDRFQVTANNISQISYNFILKTNTSAWINVNETVNGLEYIGLANVACQTEFDIVDVVNKSCKFNFIAHMSLHVFLSILCLVLLLYSCCKQLESNKRYVMKNKNKTL